MTRPLPTPFQPHNQGMTHPFDQKSKDPNNGNSHSFLSPPFFSQQRTRNCIPARHAFSLRNMNNYGSTPLIPVSHNQYTTNTHSAEAFPFLSPHTAHTIFIRPPSKTDTKTHNQTHRKQTHQGNTFTLAPSQTNPGEEGKGQQRCKLGVRETQPR